VDESLLAEGSTMIVDDETMKNSTSSLENLQKKSRRKIERICYFGSRSEMNEC
jgi:hypothetical protein